MITPIPDWYMLDVIKAVAIRSKGFGIDDARFLELVGTQISVPSRTQWGKLTPTQQREYNGLIYGLDTSGYIVRIEDVDKKVPFRAHIAGRLG